ncbi:MAG TPA: 1,6-anhydro-N-acetylmuramyl-L-alanine amidase AmpD [Steroidobacteraceae bacterium]|nr:1,6-anhydro-N-acetylmuramyl-L-alanine amidase AmpD [Steroidobacteraceae bacterium]
MAAAMPKMPPMQPSSEALVAPAAAAPRLRIDAGSGMLMAVPQVISPHCDTRPGGVLPELIVIHGISVPAGQFGGPWIDRLFAGDLPSAASPQLAALAGLRVSAHVVIRRDGTPTQYVPFGLRAWHAGVSSYAGRSACNDFSVGIELEGTDALPYEPLQYATLADLIRELCRVYPSLSAQRLVGHSDIAPGRKSDPGPAFDWPRLRSLLQAIGAP